jgi:hypothetical protein
VSNLYVKVSTGFYAHRKTLRLRAAIGDDAFWIPPRLWAYAVENQPDGIFENYSAGEIASLIGYTRDASSMLQALLKAGYMDESPLRIHDWQEHNQYHATYAARAKKAAAARWSKQSPSTPSPDNGKDKGEGGGASIATSNATSIPSALKMSEQIKLEKSLGRALAELKQLGSLNDYDKGTRNHSRILELQKEIPALRKQLGVVA